MNYELRIMNYELNINELKPETRNPKLETNTSHHKL